MDLRRAAPWARAAGVAGLAANALLVAFYALEAGRRRVLPVSLGTANDLVGALSTALMVPVVLALSPTRWIRRLGLTATGVLTLAGPALVLGLVPVGVQVPVALAAFALLAGGGVLAGGAVAALGALLPRRARLVGRTIGGVPAALGGLAVPVWFLRVGRG